MFGGNGEFEGGDRAGICLRKERQQCHLGVTLGALCVVGGLSQLRMSMQRVGVRAVRTGARGFHCTPAASAAISFNSVISKVSNEADKARLINLQKVHDGAKGALHGVKDTAESIDFAEWSAKIGDAATVAEIKAAYEAVTLPSASDTTMVDHPAWDQNEFAKLSASLGLQNEETAADLSKLKAYQQYLKDMPAVSEMTVEDVLGKNSALDYQVQRQMDEMEVLPPLPPTPFSLPPSPLPALPGVYTLYTAARQHRVCAALSHGYP